MSYTIGSEEITFSDKAPAEIAGTTQTRWYVAAPDGRHVIGGLHTEAEAEVARAERIHNEEPVAVTLANGDSVRVARVALDRFRGIDQYGNKVLAMEVGSDYTYALTPCCDATGKGGERGIVCRACYREVPSYFGGPAEVAFARTS